MKAKSKATAGVIVMIGIPAVVAVILVSLGISFAHQHVHDRNANIISDTQATVTVNDFHHSTAGIVAVSAGLAFVGLLALLLCVLAGGSMIDSRNRSWE